MCYASTSWFQGYVSVVIPCATPPLYICSMDAHDMDFVHGKSGKGNQA
jgi:hypothetical protein